jgi:hypothetical protein
MLCIMHSVCDLCLLVVLNFEIFHVLQIVALFCVYSIQGNDICKPIKKYLKHFCLVTQNVRGMSWPGMTYFFLSDVT